VTQARDIEGGMITVWTAHSRNVKDIKSTGSGGEIG
jgi:hypothetical protein